MNAASCRRTVQERAWCGGGGAQSPGHALHGLLQQGRDVGLPLVSVIRVEPAQPAGPTVEPR